MKDAELKALTKRAGEIAKAAPATLREAAFNRALDALLSTQVPQDKAPPRDRSTGKPVTTPPAEKALEDESLITAINRTKHPDVGATRAAKDRALKVLELARDEYGVDGLTAAQISEILTSVFKLRTERAAVRMALERATDTVHAIRNSKPKVYQLMAAGEDYLRSLREGNSAATSPKQRSRAAKKKAAKKPKKTTQKKKAASKQKSAAGKKATSKKSTVRHASERPGPKAALTDLISAGFFSNWRTSSGRFRKYA